MSEGGKQRLRGMADHERSRGDEQLRIIRPSLGIEG
jgi:hypothetical protein